jgi:hypothetical protein
MCSLSNETGPHCVWLIDGYCCWRALLFMTLFLVLKGDVVVGPTLVFNSFGYRVTTDRQYTDWDMDFYGLRWRLGLYFLRNTGCSSI